MSSFRLEDYIKKPKSQSQKKQNESQLRMNPLELKMSKLTVENYQKVQEMRGYLIQLLNRFYNGERMNRIIDKLLEKMIDTPDDFVKIFENRGKFYQSVSGIESSIS
jgi:hypothetical protein